MIPGLSNFRDCGDPLLNPGTVLLRGRLFRSAAPGALLPEGVNALAKAGIGRIVDLRGTLERANAAQFNPGEARIVVHSIPVEPRSSALIRQALAEGTASAEGMRAIMTASYRAYVTEEAAAFGRALEILAADEPPAMIHCTAGKDRTGFLVALVKAALGASRETIIADYLRTNADWDRASVSDHLPLDREEVMPILLAEEGYLDAAFAEIQRLDGDVQGFIARATGGRVDAARLARLKRLP